MLLTRKSSAFATLRADHIPTQSANLGCLTRTRRHEPGDGEQLEGRMPRWRTVRSDQLTWYLKRGKAPLHARLATQSGIYKVHRRIPGRWENGPKGSGVP